MKLNAIARIAAILATAASLTSAQGLTSVLIETDIENDEMRIRVDGDPFVPYAMFVSIGDSVPTMLIDTHPLRPGETFVLPHGTTILQKGDVQLTVAEVQPTGLSVYDIQLPRMSMLGRLSDRQLAQLPYIDVAYPATSSQAQGGGSFSPIPLHAQSRGAGSRKVTIETEMDEKVSPPHMRSLPSDTWVVSPKGAYVGNEMSTEGGLLIVTAPRY